MSLRILRSAFVALAGLVALANAQAQNFRQFIAKPEKPIEYWNAMLYEIELGQFNLAAEHLKGFLKSNPSDEDLLHIEAKDGMSSFLKLLTIPQLRADAGPLLERMSAVLKKHLSDPQRIEKFVRNLSATPEERVFALRELQRSGAAAVPHLIAALQKGTPSEQAAILTVLPRLYKETVPPIAAALDMDDPVLKTQLIDVLQRRGAVEAVPELWYLAASPKEAESVQKKAVEALAYLLETSPERLPRAKVALTQQAERYFQHQVRFENPQAVPIWRWDGKGLVSETRPASKAEEYFGLRYARQALELDPTFEPAQIVFLSLALEKAMEGAGYDQPLSKAAPQAHELVSSVNPDLVTTVLERALVERRLPIILATVRALGDLAEVRAARPTTRGMPALVRALNYPDRRVALAAADALLRIPGPPVSVSSARVVEVLRRALAAEPKAKALIGDFDAARAQATAAAVAAAGFEPVVVPTGREVLRRLREAADIDVILLDPGIPDPQLPYLLPQLRADIDVGTLPVLLLLTPDPPAPVPGSAELLVRSLAKSYRHVWVLSRPTPEQLKEELPARITEALGQPMSEDERKAQAALAMVWLKRLATGEVPGYDIRPAEAAILKALHHDELAHLAIEAAGRLPARVAQPHLADLVLDGNRRPELRLAAAEELIRAIQEQGLVLPKQQLAGLEALAAQSDAPLKGTLARVLGTFRPSAERTGKRLLRYSPAPPAAPMPPAER